MEWKGRFEQFNEAYRSSTPNPYHSWKKEKQRNNDMSRPQTAGYLHMDLAEWNNTIDSLKFQSVLDEDDFTVFQGLNRGKNNRSVSSSGPSIGPSDSRPTTAALTRGNDWGRSQPNAVIDSRPPTAPMSEADWSRSRPTTALDSDLGSRPHTAAGDDWARSRPPTGEVRARTAQHPPEAAKKLPSIHSPVKIASPVRVKSSEAAPAFLSVGEEAGMDSSLRRVWPGTNDTFKIAKREALTGLFSVPSREILSLANEVSATVMVKPDEVAEFLHALEMDNQQIDVVQTTKETEEEGMICQQHPSLLRLIRFKSFLRQFAQQHSALRDIITTIVEEYDISIHYLFKCIAPSSAPAPHSPPANSDSKVLSYERLNNSLNTLQFELNEANGKLATAKKEMYLLVHNEQDLKAKLDKCNEELLTLKHLIFSTHNFIYGRENRIADIVRVEQDEYVSEFSAMRLPKFEKVQEISHNLNNVSFQSYVQAIQRLSADVDLLLNERKDIFVSRDNFKRERDAADESMKDSIKKFDRLAATYEQQWKQIESLKQQVRAMTTKVQKYEQTRNGCKLAENLCCESDWDLHLEEWESANRINVICGLLKKYNALDKYIIVCRDSETSDVIEVSADSSSDSAVARPADPKYGERPSLSMAQLMKENNDRGHHSRLRTVCQSIFRLQMKSNNPSEFQIVQNSFLPFLRVAPDRTSPIHARVYSRADLERVYQDIWKERSQAKFDLEFCDIVQTWINRNNPDREARVEVGYSLIYFAEKFALEDINSWVFLQSLYGFVCADLYPEMNKKVEEFKAFISANSSSGMRIGRVQMWKCLERFFPNKTEEQHWLLRCCVLVMTSFAEEFSVAELFHPASRLVAEVNRQCVMDYERYIMEFTRALYGTSSCRDPQVEVSMGDVCNAMKCIDPHITESEIKRRIKCSLQTPTSQTRIPLEYTNPKSDKVPVKDKRTLKRRPTSAGIEWKEKIVAEEFIARLRRYCYVERLTLEPNCLKSDHVRTLLYRPLELLYTVEGRAEQTITEREKLRTLIAELKDKSQKMDAEERDSSRRKDRQLSNINSLLKSKMKSHMKVPTAVEDNESDGEEDDDDEGDEEAEGDVGNQQPLD